MRVSRAFGWPEGGGFKVWARSWDGKAVAVAPGVTALVKRLVTDGPMVVSQAVRVLTGNEHDRDGRQRIEQWQRAGWLAVCDWRAPLADTAALWTQQRMRLVALGQGAMQQYQAYPDWVWAASTICRGVVTAQLRLRMAVPYRWRACHPHRPLVGQIEIAGGRAWVVVLRRGRNLQGQLDAFVADYTHAQVQDEDRLWLVVPSEKAEDREMAATLVQREDLGAKALLTVDWALWGQAGLESIFMRWTGAGWKPVTISSLRAGSTSAAEA